MSTNPSYIPFAELSVEDKWKIANEGIPEKLQAIKDGKGIDFLYLSGSPSILQAITDHGYQPDEKIIDAYSKRTRLMKQADGIYEQLRHHELWLAGDLSGKRLEITDELQGCDLDGMHFNLSHAKFHGNTRVVNFGDTLLYGASFDGDVRASVFKNGDLTQADFTEAKTDWIIVKDCSCVYSKGLPADGENHCVIENVYSTDDYLSDLKTKPSRGVSLKEIGEMSKMASSVLKTQTMSEPAVAQMER